MTALCSILSTLIVSCMQCPTEGINFSKYTDVSAVAIMSEVYHSGCCSHHGGVCGCDVDRARCCDGTDSPSCDCS
jgi:hypothetical protein